MKPLLRVTQTLGLLLVLACTSIAATTTFRVVDQAGQPVPSAIISYSYTATAPALPGSGRVLTNSEGVASLAHPCGASGGSCCTLTSAVSYTISLPGWQFSPNSGTVPCGVGSFDLMVKGDNLVVVPAVVSAASYSPDLAVGMIASMFGAALATTTAKADGTPLPTTLGGRNIVLRDSTGVTLPAPLFYVSPLQINFYLPMELAEGQFLVTVRSDTAALSSHFITVRRVAPSLFAANADGQGVAAANLLRVRGDGSRSEEAVARLDPAQNKFVAVPLDLGPATDQVFLSLYGTGIRQRSSLAATLVKLDDAEAEVLYAGAQGEYIGLDQVNIELPRSLLGRSEVNIVLTVDGKTANPVKISIK